jgi:hypothetical protein
MIAGRGRSHMRVLDADGRTAAEGKAMMATGNDGLFVLP